ncbi:MAG: hypothetical protein ABNH02_01545 [Pseudomonadales bacterium]|jgi:hypothetical protein|uniref:Uncharacterized protein n=1 Tax=Umboniibacter marinipuniceus TaxID=569599 RepID=A0A3M0AQM5_9GAMM|nr:hypothetical protein [Umboniibacter marinipuniceus]RMA81302.1 hypothetical protein DFR27_1118 [Umboniibacter marinipuniceus]
MDTVAIQAEEVAVKQPKKRGRRKKTERERNMRRMIEDKLDEMRLQRNVAQYCFDD